MVIYIPMLDDCSYREVHGWLESLGPSSMVKKAKVPLAEARKQASEKIEEAIKTRTARMNRGQVPSKEEGYRKESQEELSGKSRPMVSHAVVMVCLLIAKASDE